VCVVEWRYAGQRLMEPPSAEVGVEDVGEEELQDGEEDARLSATVTLAATASLDMLSVNMALAASFRAWVMHTSAGTNGLKKFLEQRLEPDLAVLLPMGFLERTRAETSSSRRGRHMWPCSATGRRAPRRWRGTRWVASGR
jgi:hypothetical protein